MHERVAAMIAIKEAQEADLRANVPAPLLDMVHWRVEAVGDGLTRIRLWSKIKQEALGEGADKQAPG